MVTTNPTSKKKGLTMLSALLLIGMLPTFTVTIFMCVYSAINLKQELVDGVYTELRIAAEDLAQHYEDEFSESADGTLPKEYDYVDSLLDEDIDLTIFIDDTRYLTSLKNENGERNEGTQADSAIAQKVLSGEEYEAHNVKIGNTKFYVHYSPLRNDQDQIVGMAFAGTPQSDVENAIRKAVIIAVVVSLVLAGICAFLIFIVASKIKKNMAISVKRLEKIESGDLSPSAYVHSAVREIQTIIDSTSALQANLSDSIGGVKNTAEDLGLSVNEVDGLSNNSANGASQISSAVDELTTTAQNMAENVQDANGAVVEMGDAIANISSSTSLLADESDKMKEANEAAMENMKTLMQYSRSSGELVEEIAEQVSNTNESVDKINDAIQLILEIASQTNLLALNASIEAARAGDAGRGFAVVATEIQKLAEDSSNSANTIRDISNEIVAMSKKSVEMTEEVAAAIKTQRQCVRDTNENINLLSEGVNRVIEEVQDISSQADNLNVSKDIVLNNISDLSAISEENAASSQEVNASVETIAGAISGTKDKSGEMKDMAEKLTQMVNYFKI